MQFRNRETAQETQQCDGHQRRHDQRDAAVGGEQAGDQRAQHDGHERAHFHHGVAADQFGVAQHFGQQAVFGGSEEGGVHAHQEQGTE